jgi:hypothetical protein
MEVYYINIKYKNSLNQLFKSIVKHETQARTLSAYFNQKATSPLHTWVGLGTS